MRLKRTLATLLTAVLLCTSIDISVFAAEIAETVQTTTEEETVESTSEHETSSSVEESVIETSEEESVEIESSEEEQGEVETASESEEETENLPEESTTVTVTSEEESSCKETETASEESTEDIEMDDVQSGEQTYQLTYKVLSDGTAEITGFTGTASGDLIIPEEIDGYKVTAIGDESFYSMGTTVHFNGKLELPGGLKRIGNRAFGCCFYLTGDLIIPDSVTEIGSSAFSSCKSLTGDLIIPENVTVIKSGAFSQCVGFNGELKLPDRLERIEDLAFQVCSGFTGNLVIPDSVTYIGSNAFSGCSGFIGELIIPDGVTWIGYKAFKNCSGFTGDWNIPDGVTEIRGEAFAGCSGFTGDLIIPEGVAEIGEEAFAGCSGFTGKLVIPNDDIILGRGVFKNCSGLTGKLTIPNNLTKIEYELFRGCSGFTGDLQIPEGVTEIDGDAFAGCSGLSGEWKIPEGVTEIVDGTFGGCSGFTGNLVIPERVTYIGAGAFSGCSGFTGELIIPKGITKIYRSTFSGCSGFTGKLIIPEGVTEISESAFYNCSNFTGELIIPKNVTRIGVWAFKDLTNIKKIVISDKVETIGEYAFSSTKSLELVYIPSNVISIDKTAFSNVNSKCIFYVEEGSYAQKYCKSNNLPYRIWKKTANQNYIIQVVDDDGQPLSGVRVSCDNVRQSKYTDKNGMVTISGSLADASHTIYLSKEDLGTYAEKRILNATEVNVFTLSDEVENFNTYNGLISLESSLAGVVPLEAAVNIKGEDIKWLDVDFAYDFGDVAVGAVYEGEDNTLKLTLGNGSGEDGREEIKENKENARKTYDITKEMCEAFDVLNLDGASEADIKKAKATVESCKKKLKELGEMEPGWKNGKVGVDSEVNVYGYVELALDEFGDPTEVIGGGAYLEVECEGSITGRPVWGAGVAYVKVTLALNANGELELTFGEKEQHLLMTLDVALEEALGIGLGVGADFAHLEIGAEGSLGEEFYYSEVTEKKAEKEPVRISCNAKIYAEAKAFLWEESVSYAFGGEDGWQIYPKTTSAGAETKSLNSLLYGGMNAEKDSYSLAERNYLPAQSYTETAAGNKSTGVYSDATPEIVRLDNGTVVAVWINDNGQKNSLNRTTLVYAVNTGNGWTTPKAVKETGRGDFYPSLYAAGNVAHLVWLNSSKEMTANSLEAQEQNVDVYYAKFTGTAFLEPELLSEADNGVLEARPMVAASSDGSRISVVWVENTSNDSFLTDGRNTIYERVYENGAWGTKKTIKTGIHMLQSMDITYIDDGRYIAYTADEDGNADTTEDIRAYCVNAAGAQPLARKGAACTNVQFSGQHLFYNYGNRIYCTNIENTGDTIATNILDAGNFTVTEQDGRRVITYLEKKLNIPTKAGSLGGLAGLNELLKNGNLQFSNVIVACYEESTGNYSSPVRKTPLNYNISDYAVLCNGNELQGFIIGEEREAKEYEAQTLSMTDNQYNALADADADTDTTFWMLNDEIAFSSLSITKLFCDYEQAVEGASLPVTAEVYNESGVDISSVEISVSDGENVLYTTTVSVSIPEGETKELEFTYPVDQLTGRQSLAVTIMPADYTDSLEEDNMAYLEIGFGDVVVSDLEMVSSENGEVITGKISNHGVTAVENVTLQILNKELDMPQIYSIEYGEMAAGAEYLIEYAVPEEYLAYTKATDKKCFEVTAQTSSVENSTSNNTGTVLAFPVRVTGLELDTDSITLPEKSIKQLTASVSPENAMEQGIHYTSDDNKVASVTEDGVIIAKKAGEAVITAVSADGGFVKKCNVTVTENDSVEYELNRTEAELEKEESLQLQVNAILSGNAVTEGVTWSSSNETVVTVDESGKVTAVSAGTAYILVNVGENYYDACLITVKEEEQEVMYLTPVKLSLTEGEREELEVSYIGNSTTVVTWNSSDESVATVSNGVVTAVGAGSAVITAQKGSLRAECSVRVIGLPRYKAVFIPDNGGEYITITDIKEGSCISLPSSPALDGYLFSGWYTERNGQGTKFSTGTPVTGNLVYYAYWRALDELPEEELPGDVLPEDMPEDGVDAIPDGLWIAGVDESGYDYTGSAIKPSVRVYDYKTLLVEKKDYTISYKNNKKAYTLTEGENGFNSKKAPTITVKGKGNYTGTETVTYVIRPLDINGENFDLDNLSAAYNRKKVQKPVPTLLWKGKKLKNKTDFKVTWPDTMEGAYKEPGTYTIKVEGINNYTGTRTLTFEIANVTPISKVSVKNLKSQTYTGDEVKPEFKVMHGKKELTENVDYTFKYEDNVNVGTAYVVLTGIGAYSGQKRVSFKITGWNIKKAKVISGLPKEVPYDGTAQTPECVLQTVINGQDVPLYEDQHYTVTYDKNINAGTASVIFTGINGFSGTLKKTFKITKFKLATDTEKQFTVEEGIEAVYTKGGSKPEPVVQFNGKVLTKGTDYTLSYKKNKALNDGSDPDNAPLIVVKGKGNFDGAKTVSFTIGQADIGKLSIAVADRVYSTKKNGFKSAPKISDTDGKALKAGTDYKKDILYTYKEDTLLANGTQRTAGETVDAKDIVPVGTLLKVTVYGDKNYSGGLTGEYRILAKGKDIKSAKVSVAPETYTGKAITLDKKDIKVKLGRVYLKESDFEIVEGSYKNNIKKGKASLVIRGVGEYGGTKTVSFTIKAKTLSWWEKLTRALFG